jgi:predicted kinase
MDGDFYLKNLRSAEYSTLFNLAFSALRFERFVLINAPFLKEVRDIEFMQTLKKRSNECGADLVVIWITAPIDVCYERMKKRNANRDTLKLSKWQEYIKQTDYSTPSVLEEINAVDGLFVFDNTSEKTAIKSVNYIIGKLEE